MSALRDVLKALQEKWADSLGDEYLTDAQADALAVELDAWHKAELARVIGEDEDNYRPYLVVRHKLGMEANQTQARLIATCLNKLRSEQRKRAGL